MTISSNADNLANLKLLRLLFGVPDRAVMGDNVGSIYYAPESTVDSTDLGYFPVRLLDGLDANGNAIPGTVVPMVTDVGFITEYGLDILVHKTPSGVYIFGGLDNEALAKRGKNPTQYTNTQATPKNVFRRNIWTGKIIPDLDVNGDYTQKLRRYGYDHIGYDGDRHTWGLGSSNALDFTDDFPAATFERYALTYYDPVSSTSGYVLTDSQTISNSYSATEADALIALLPHQLCQPGEVFRLDGNKGWLDQSDNRGDFRELWTAPLPVGMPKTIGRNIVLVADYENILKDYVEYEDGYSISYEDGASLEYLVDNLSAVVASISSGSFSPKSFNYTTETTNYTVAATDGAVIMDATSGALTLTLPDSTTVAGREYDIFMKVDGTVDFATTSSQEINFTTVFTGLQMTIAGETRSFKSIGSGGWLVL